VSKLDIPTTDPAARMAQRLAFLREEYEAGQAQLRALEQRTRELQNTMLRIAGAIAVLEELSAESRPSDD
jgi:prefoldin subunit 5